MVELSTVIKYLKKNDRNLYNQFKDCIANPVVLVNKLVRHYQWIFEIRDISILDLQDRYNKNYLNLFLYAMECDNELANNFINYFAFCFRNCFDFNSRSWNIDLIFNTFIHKSTSNEFDLVAMYVLIASTFDRFIKFFNVFEPKEKLMLSADEVFELFMLIVDQQFYDDLKNEIVIKRRNSFYHKQPDFEIRLPLRGNDLIKKQKVNLFSRTKDRVEQEFEKWDNSSQFDFSNQNESLYQQEIGIQTPIQNQVSEQAYLNKISNNEKIIDNVYHSEESNYIHEENNVESKFKPNPNIKIIKLRAFDL